MNMEKAKIAIPAVLLIALLLSGCRGAAFTIINGGNRSTIEASDAPDGATAESGVLTVGKGKTVVVSSTLDRGELKIDFAEASVFGHEDAEDDVIAGDVIVSVTLGGGDSSSFSLEKGEYVMQITAIGNTNGKVTVNIQ